MTQSNISGAKQRQIKAVVSEIVGAKLATLSAAAGDRLIARLDAFEESLAPAIRSAIAQFSVAPSPVLKLVNASVPLDAIATYDPKRFRTRKCVLVSDDFHRLIGSKAKPVKNLPAITLMSADFIKRAYAADVKADPLMPADHAFASESEFVAYLNQMISKQQNGKGQYLNFDGYVNIFFVAGHVVGVYWDARDWAWYVGLVNGCLGVGTRVFGRNET